MNKKKVTLLISAIVLATSMIFCSIPVKAAGTAYNKTSGNDKKMTVMVYSDADNNLESDLLNDIQEMKDGYVNNPNVNLIVLVDRAPYYSSDSKVLGANFTDTRMFKIEEGKAVRINGGSEFPEITTQSRYEADMGDPNTLKKFIDSCKANYPADEYALIISNHGGGARENYDKGEKTLSKAVCWDDTDDEDCMYTAEITDSLSNKESVDLLAFDACLMGTAEVAYQYRPGNGSFQADYMVASAPTVWGNGFDYKRIFNRFTGQGSSSLASPEELGNIMVQAQKESVNEAGDSTQVLSNFNLKKIGEVKKSVDNLARALWIENGKAPVESLRGSRNSTSLIHYFNTSNSSEWLEYPYFDLCDLCKKINTSSNFSNNVKSLAQNVVDNVDSMIEDSFGGSDYKGFSEGINGLSIFLPDGSRVYRDYYSGTRYTAWQAQRWYNSEDLNSIEPDFPYGKLSWCRDGQSSKINDVGNWFELLDSWFDTSNDSEGGVNYYQW